MRNYKWLFVVGLLLFWGPAFSSALDERMQAAMPDYQQLRDLQARFGSARRLPADGSSSRGEYMLALAETANLAATGEAPVLPGGVEPEWKDRDYDALYSLLQRYRDDLRALGLSQKTLEDELAALKVREARLKDRLDHLQPPDGMKIHGRILTLFDDMIIVGPGWGGGKATRWREGLSRGSLDFSMTRGPASANVQFEMQRVFGDMYDCTTCKSGVTHFYTELRFPITIQAGDMPGRMTPLTLWRQEDPQPFEAEPFHSRRLSIFRQREMESGDNAWRMRAVRASTEARLFDFQTMQLEAMVTSSGTRGVGIYTRGTAPTLNGNPGPGTIYVAPYSQYFGAWRVGLPFGNAMLAGQGTIFRDSSDSAVVNVGTAQLGAYESDVQSLEAKWHSQEERFKVRLEGAMSQRSDPLYNPGSSSDFVTGTAALVDADMNFGWLGLHLHGRKVDDTFISAAAQGRSWDSEKAPLGPFATENILYNPGTDGYGSILPGGAGVEPPESGINTLFLPPRLAATAVTDLGNGYLLPHHPGMNAISPYGPATPNRQGFGAELELRPWNGGLKLDVLGDSATELAGKTPVSYLSYGAGLKADLRELWAWPFTLQGGVTVEDTRDSGFVAFTSTLADYGLSWQAGDNLWFDIGGRHLDYNGTLRYTGTDPFQLAFGKAASRQVWDLLGYGMRWKMSDVVSLRMLYSQLLFVDMNDGSLGKKNHFEADQGVVELSIQF